MDDRQIVAMLFERSEQGLDQLKTKYGALFTRIAQRYLADASDAEEVISDLYLALWRNIPPERPESLKAYSATILRNLCLKCIRDRGAQKRSSQYAVSLEELAPYLPGGTEPEAELNARELGELVNRFLADLDKQDRVAFVRRYYLAETPVQIGKALGRSARYISVRLHRVREKLRAYLVREGIEI